MLLGATKIMKTIINDCNSFFTFINRNIFFQQFFEIKYRTRGNVIIQGFFLNC